MVGSGAPSQGAPLALGALSALVDSLVYTFLTSSEPPEPKTASNEPRLLLAGVVAMLQNAKVTPSSYVLGICFLGVVAHSPSPPLLTLFCAATARARYACTRMGQSW